MSELRFDPAFDRVVWRVQRFGWAGMLMAVIAAFAGWTGDGPASDAVVYGRTVRVSYQRFLRLGSDASVEFALPPDARALWLNQEYVRHFLVDSITPEPSAVYVSGSNLVYSFPGPASPVRFRMRAKDLHAGWLECVAGTESEQMKFRQFVWP